MKAIFTAALITWCSYAIGQVKYVYQRNESFTYEQAIDAFQLIAEESPFVELIETPHKTDVGRPLHTVIFNAKKEFDPQKIDRSTQVVYLINNAIHPGESCGVDASVKLFEQLARYHKQYENVVVVAIPVYNIGGMLNRSPYKRSGQLGPAECGFRGNYQHLDLNRDFIKCDALNTEGFVQIFHEWKPNIFMDTHTTNGSDHQYTVTLITSQRDKMNPVLADYVFGKMEPMIFRNMKLKGKEIVPYVYSMNRTPETGIKDFMETPRYSSGYTNLFNCISFISEAHKYKTFTQRVEHTYALLEFVAEYASKSVNDLIALKRLADEYTSNQNSFYLNWQLDTSKFEELFFRGYEIETVKSITTGLDRTNYNRSKPIEKEIRYYRNYHGMDQINAPKYYVLPQCYRKISSLLELNEVELYQLKQDSTFNGEMYIVDDLQSLNSPYEKHFLHKHIHVTPQDQQVKFYKGDWLIPTNQPNKRFIIETLEPHAADSYFRWNYFDNVMQQKEWFSDLAFDTIANNLLTGDEKLNEEFKIKLESDTNFAKSHFQQMQWIFVRSPYYESEHRRYPVMRITE